MVCKILESIRNSGVRLWVAVKEVDTSEFGYEPGQEISTKVLLTDLEKLYDDKDAESTCYEIEEAVMCLRPNEPQDAVNKWENVTYETHEKYPIIPKGDLWRNEEKIGIVENYNSVEHFGHMILDIYPPGETNYLASEYIVKVSGKTITPVGRSWDNAHGIWVNTREIEHTKRVFDETNTVENLDISLLDEHARSGIALGKFEDALETAQRIISKCSDMCNNQQEMNNDPNYFPALRNQIIALIGLEDDAAFDLLLDAFEYFPKNDDLTLILAKLFSVAQHTLQFAILERALDEKDLFDGDKFSGFLSLQKIPKDMNDLWESN